MASTPLFTIFKPPASCFDNQYQLGEQKLYLKDISFRSPQCYPAGFQALYSAQKPYRPGVCPSSYVVAKTILDKDVTSAVCCPSSWTAYSSGLGCSLRLTAPSTIKLPTKVTVAPSGASLAMHGIFVAWAAGDLKLFTPASAPILALAMKTTASSASRSSSVSSSASFVTSTTQSSTRTSTTHSSTSSSGAAGGKASSGSVSAHKGISPGAIAGVSVVLTLLVLIGGAVALVFFWRRRRRSHSQQAYIEFDEKTDRRSTANDDVATDGFSVQETQVSDMAGAQTVKRLSSDTTKDALPPPIMISPGLKKSWPLTPVDDDDSIAPLSPITLSGRLSRSFSQPVEHIPPVPQLYELAAEEVELSNLPPRIGVGVIELEGSSPTLPWVTHHELDEQR